MSPGKVCKITRKNTHLQLKLRILFILFLFLGSEGGAWHSGPLRTLVASIFPKVSVVSEYLPEHFKPIRKPLPPVFCSQATKQ